MTDRAIAALWLQETFRHILGWRLMGIVPRSPGVLDVALLDSSIEAVVVDVSGDVLDAVEFCRCLASRYTSLKVVTMSCCHRGDDAISASLTAMGLPDVLVCDRLPAAFAADLARLLNRCTVTTGEESLSDLDRDLILLCAQGLRSKEIGRTLHVSPHTVRHRLEALRARCGAATTAGLVGWAAARGLVVSDSG